MKHLKLPLLLVGLSGLVFFTQAEHISDPSLVAEGAKVYNENCGRCHNPRPASDYTKQEWSVVMPHMREKAHMTGKETLAVEAFIAQTLTADVRNNPLIRNAQDKLLTGEQLVSQFGCQGCHQIKGKGGSLGSNLDGIVTARGRDFVIKKLKDPTFNNAASAMPQFPMSEDDLQAIVNYLSDN